MALLAVVCACQGNETVLTKEVPNLTVANVTPSVASKLDAGGHFLLSHTPLDPTRPEIDQQTAKRLGAAFMKTFGGWVRTLVEKDRGVPVHLNDLVPCERAFYAASAYEPTGEDAPLFIRKSAGPQWLVPMCYAGVEEVMVTVSAYATDASIDGRNQISNLGVNNFMVQGVPPGIEIPAEPEQVATSSARLTGRRIADVPELVMRPRPWGAALAVWRLTFEDSASFRSGNRSVRLKQAYAGFLNSWEVKLLNSDSTQVNDPDQRYVRYGEGNIEKRYPITLRQVPRGFVTLTSEAH